MNNDPLTYFLLVISLGFLGAIFLRGIYSVLRLRRSALEAPTTYISSDLPLNYLSLKELISQRNKKWFQYICFRFIPPLITSFLIIGEFSIAHSGDIIGQIIIVISCVLFYFVLDIPHIVKERHTLSWKLLYVFILTIIVAASVVDIVLINTFDLSMLLPNFSNIIDGLWTALFVAVVVAIYLRLTNMNERNKSNESSFVSNQDFIRKQEHIIEAKYGSVIEQVANENNLDQKLIMAILIYENLNRPKGIRIMENVLIRIFHLELTAGIAQVKTNHPITDEDSIIKMGEYLRNCMSSIVGQGVDSKGLNDALIRQYNIDPTYATNVKSILEML